MSKTNFGMRTSPLWVIPEDAVDHSRKALGSNMRQSTEEARDRGFESYFIPSLVTHAFNPSTQEAEGGGSL